MRPAHPRLLLPPLFLARFAAGQLEAFRPELWPGSHQEPPECANGCLPWDEVPDNILQPYNFSSPGALFLSGEAPSYRVCAKPHHLPRDEPWCYCPGPVRGWAYCVRVAVNCSKVLANAAWNDNSPEANSCRHRMNMCGTATLPCRKAVLGKHNEMYYKERATYADDGSFTRVISHSMTNRDCKMNRFFVTMTVSGSWRHDGPSKYANDSSTFTTEVSQAWLQIVQEENCYPTSQYSLTEEAPKCFKTSDVLKDLCPCNGWPFIQDGDYVKRNIMLFCRPEEQCPILLGLIIRKPAFSHYNASSKAYCFYKPYANPVDGWGQGWKNFVPNVVIVPTQKPPFQEVPWRCTTPTEHLTCSVRWGSQAMMDSLPDPMVDIVKLAYYEREDDAQRAVEAVQKKFGTDVDVRIEQYTTTEFRVIIFKLDTTLTWQELFSVITEEYHAVLEACQRKEAEEDCYPEPVFAHARLFLLVQMVWLFS
jgi:hypothetical protein